jgi:DNA-binding MarR family transcriptional regulator
VAKLAEEIQSKPFVHIEEEAVLNIVRTADLLSQQTAQLLKGFDLSTSQYNVLRILRGSPDGLPAGQIASRMISRDPDVTRLLDRLESRSLIQRCRDHQDRRVVAARITSVGLDLLSALDAPIVAETKRQLGPMGEEKLRVLIDLLEQVRQISQSKKEKP